jgi:hypothetical protein
MSDPVVPIGASISTPINRTIAAATSIGFNAGAAGVVTQATNKSTGVTLNTQVGVITMHNAALNDTVSVQFTLTNDKIQGTDLLLVNQGTGGTAGSYAVQALSVGAGSAIIRVTNISGGNLSEAVTINFAVIDTVAA